MKQFLPFVVLTVASVNSAMAGINQDPGRISVDEPSMLPLMAGAALAVYAIKKFKK